MIEVRFSIITPTIGRPTLDRTIRSALRSGFIPGVDEFTVVGDGPQPEAVRIAALFSKDGIRYIETAPDHYFGHPQNEAAMAEARGTHLAFIDDDDYYADGAIDHMRKVVTRNPSKVTIFRTDLQEIPRIMWREKSLYEGNIGTPSAIFPNVPARLGKWGRRYGGDFDFVRSTVNMYPNKDADVVWDEKITVIVPRFSHGRGAT